MRKILTFLLFVVAFASISVSFSSCGGDEPDDPQKEQTDPSHENPSDSHEGGEDKHIPGNKILGTWYYLNPNKALKVTITFTSEESYNFSIFGDRKCYI